MCDGVPTSTCEGHHSVVNLKTFVKDFKSSLSGSLTGTTDHLHEAVAKREQLHEHLFAQIAANNSCLQKLRSNIRENATKNSLATGKNVDFIAFNKELEEAKKEAKKEVEEADRMLQQLITFTASAVISKDKNLFKKSYM